MPAAITFDGNDGKFMSPPGSLTAKVHDPICFFWYRFTSASFKAIPGNAGRNRKYFHWKALLLPQHRHLAVNSAGKASNELHQIRQVLETRPALFVFTRTWCFYGSPTFGKTIDSYLLLFFTGSQTLSTCRFLLSQVETERNHRIVRRMVFASRFMDDRFVSFQKSDKMATENILENLSAGFAKDASVKNLFGEPVQAHGKTIIPVAKITYGFGGGYGQGKRKWAGDPQSGNSQSAGQDPEGKGAGGGGGLHAVAKGVFEITPTSTRFIPATPVRHLLVGMAAGFLLKAFFFSRRK